MICKIASNGRPHDLRLVAWIGEAGSLAGAAKRLGVNHATVFRRLNQLEQRLGVRLFERSNGRYRPTPAGDALVQAGAVLDRTAHEALLKVAGHDLRPSGQVRITTTDSLALSVLQPILAGCRLRYPDIRLTLTVDNRSANLSQRDADIAIRPTSNPPDYLIGRNIAELTFAVYGARDYLARSGERPLAEHDWIGLDDSHSGHRTLRWLQTLIPLDRLAYRTGSFGLAREACRHGMGLAVLPGLLGEQSEQLQRIGPNLNACQTTLWLLMHPELRDTTRVAAVFQYLQHALGPAIAALNDEAGRRDADHQSN
ncbi:LysR family transcriptional regulator [Chitinimonas sp.]|uniref:LysR family transcriptional regulator n=1 Tax=Chitinimonas sp. TaxID=1934313 RepID=UPI0035B2B0F0